MTGARRRFVQDLAAVSEATGIELVPPGEPDAEDRRGARLAAEIVRSGWVTERVGVLRVALTPEGARDLGLEEEGAVATISDKSERSSVRLLGSEIDFGPRVRWMERARSITPHACVRGWLRSEPAPEDRLELLFAPVEDAPLHTFFAEWPRPSLERVRRHLRAFEEKHGVRSEEFAAAWREGNRSVRRLEGGEVWMSLVRASEAYRTAPVDPEGGF